jgi:predicted Zn finger-like uncharacterized protein
MKIICDSCGAKYSIADEKVAGKVFRIRCKKCGAAIMVRGEQDASVQPTTSMAPAAPSVATSPSGEGVTAMADPMTAPMAQSSSDAAWHVVLLNGEQKGPMTVDELRDLLRSSQIDLDSYVWKEGFENWLGVRQVGELSALHAMAGVAEVSSTPHAVQPAAEVYGGGVSAHGGNAERAEHAEHAEHEGGDENDDGDSSTVIGATPFAVLGADASPTKAEMEVAARSRNTRGNATDMFASVGPVPSSTQTASNLASAMTATSGAAPSSAGSATSMHSASMTGARNENSVLFSLANLQALATGSTPNQVGSSAGAASGGSVDTGRSMTGAATGEGSGLIDIRALASSLKETQDKPAAAKPMLDDFASVGGGASPFQAPLRPPVLKPERTDWSGKMMMVLIGAGVLLVGLVGVVIYLLVRQSDAPPVVAAVAPSSTGASAAPADTGRARSEVKTDKSADTTGGTGTAGASGASAAGRPEKGQEPTPTGAAEPTGSRSEDERPKREATRTRTRDGRDNSDKAPKADTTTGTSSGKGGDSTIEDLLNNAVPKKGGSAGAESSSGDDSLPDVPSRDAMLSALRGVSGQVAGCGGGKAGIAKTSITVSGATGRATNVQVGGEFAGTPVEACVARAVKGAKFPRFKRPSLKVDFPYSVR